MYTGVEQVSKQWIGLTREIMAKQEGNAGIDCGAGLESESQYELSLA